MYNGSELQLVATLACLTVAFIGLHFVKTEDDKKKVVQTFWFTDITVQYAIDTVTVITEKQGNKEFKTKRGPEIYNLFSDYYFWLNAQSEWCRAKDDCTVEDKDVLQFKKVRLSFVLGCFASGVAELLTLGRHHPRDREGRPRVVRGRVDGPQPSGLVPKQVGGDAPQTAR